MASPPVVVQSATAPQSATNPIVLSALTGVGVSSILLVSASDASINSNSVSSITDSATGFTWSLAKISNNQVDQEVWVGLPKVTWAGGSVAVTVTFASGFSCGANVHEISGANTTTPVVQSEVNSATGTTTSLPALTVPTSRLAFGAAVCHFGSNTQPTGGWTDYNFPLNGGAPGGGDAWQNGTGASMAAPVWVQPGSAAWAALMIDIQSPPPAVLANSITLAAVRRSASRMVETAAGLLAPRRRDRIVIPQLVLARV